MQLALHIILFLLIIGVIACLIGIGYLLAIREEPITCTPLDLLERKD